MENELLVAHLNSMAGVSATLKTHDNVCVQSQEIHNLGLTFVTPLGTDYNTICHISFIFCGPIAQADYKLETKTSCPGSFPEPFFAIKIERSGKKPPRNTQNQGFLEAFPDLPPEKNEKMTKSVA